MNDEFKATVTGRFIGGGLFKPKESEDDGGKVKLRFSSCIVLNKGQEKAINRIVEQAQQDKWGDKKPKGMKNFGAQLGDDPEYASYNSYFINPKAVDKPKAFIKRDGLCIAVSKEDDILYPGCYVAVSVRAYAYDGDPKKHIKPGVALSLRAVMFHKHGERLSDEVNPESEFADIESHETVDNDHEDDPFAD